jgi:uncharacterized protein (DUF2461 family)
MTSITQNTFEFLKDLKQNNDRDWFLANTAATAQTPDRVISGAHPCPRSVDVCAYFIEKWSQNYAVILMV